MIYILTTIHVVVSLFLILVVLLQQGKGADLSVFGGGGTQSAFGARGAATILHKMTVFGFVTFIVTTILIGVFLREGGGTSVMESVADETAVSVPATDEATDEGSSTDAPAVGVGVDSTSPDIQVEAEPLTDAAGATADAALEAVEEAVQEEQ